MPKVLVISGPPGAGKTTLAKQLSQRLSLPILAKDTIKESLLDSLGYSDRKRSAEIGYAAFQVHLSLAREFVTNDVNFIYETAFYAKSTSDIIEALSGADIIQAWVHADIEKMLLRAKQRERHPGHADWYDGYETECREKSAQGVYDALDIGGQLIDLNSNDFESLEYTRQVEVVVERYLA